MRAQVFQILMRLGKALAGRPLAFVEIRHRVETKTIDAEIEPEFKDAQDFAMHARVVEIQVGLMRIESVPVISAGYRIPGPVGRLEILENDPRVLVFLGCVAPDIEFAIRTARLGAARFLEPLM